MAEFIFGPFIAVDPQQTGAPIAKSAVGHLYATDGVTLLPMRDLANIQLNDATSDSNGFVQGIKVDDHSEALWISGVYRVPVRSFGGVLDQATSAAASAADSASSANAAAADASQNRVPAGGTSGQVLAKASNTDNDVTWINPPSGGGSGAGVLVLGAADPIPPGTAALTPIFRLAGALPTPSDVQMLTGPGNVTSTYGGLTTDRTLPVPTNTDVDDLLIAIGWAQASVAPYDWTLPAGWVSQFESASSRRMLIATYAVVDETARVAVTAADQRFYIDTDASATRNGVMIFRVRGANLTTPVVGVSAYADGTGTQKTFPEFAAAAPAAAQLLVYTANRSQDTGQPRPVASLPAGHQATNEAVAYGTTGTQLAESTGSVVLYPITGTTVPSRVVNWSPSWSAGVPGLHIAIAGA